VALPAARGVARHHDERRRAVAELGRARATLRARERLEGDGDEERQPDGLLHAGRHGRLRGSHRVPRAIQERGPRAALGRARARCRWSMPDALEFEARFVALENEIAELRAQEDSPRLRERIARREDDLVRERQKVYASLTAWQRTQLARHPKRPHTRDLCRL